MPLKFDDPYLTALVSGDTSEVDPEFLRKRREELEEAKRLADEDENTLLRNIKAGTKQAFHGGISTLSSAARALNAPLKAISEALPDPKRQKSIDKGRVPQQTFGDFIQKASKETSKKHFDKVQEIAQSAEAADIIAGDNKRLGRAIRSTTQSLEQLIVASPGGTVGVIGAFTAMATNDGYQDALSAGLPEEEAIKHGIKNGIIEGGITTAFQGMGKVFGNGIGGLESLKAVRGIAKEGVGGALKQAGIRTVSELTEENLIGVAQALNSAMDGVDPEAMDADRLRELFLDTTLTTLLTMGVAESGKSTIQKISELKDTPTRQEMADILGVKPKDLPDEAKTSKGRKQLRDQAIIQIASEVAETGPLEGENAQLFEPIDAPLKGQQGVAPDEAQEVTAQETQEVDDQANLVEDTQEVLQEAEEFKEASDQAVLTPDRLPAESSVAREHEIVESRVFFDSETANLDSKRTEAFNDLENAETPDGEAYSEIVGSEWSDMDVAEKESIIENDYQESQQNLEAALAQEVAEADQNSVDLASPAVLQAEQEKAQKDFPKVKRPDGTPVPEGERGGIPLQGRQRPKNDDTYTFLDPELGKNIEASRGRKVETTQDKVTKALRSAMHGLTRAQIHIPNDDFNAAANVLFRGMKDIGTNAIRNTGERIKLITDPLDNTFEKSVFNNFVVLANLNESILRGEPARFDGTPESVQAELDNISEVVAQTPNVEQAIANRKAINAEFLGRLQDADVIPKDVDREHYFHQEVLNDVSVKQSISKGSSVETVSAAKKRLVGPEKLGKRFDYNTEYIESEMRWQIEAEAAMGLRKAWKEFDRVYGKRKVFEEEAAIRNEKNPEADPVTWQQIAKENGFKVTQPKKGSGIYRALSLPDKMIKDMEDMLIETNVFNVEKDDLKSVLVIGSKFPEVALPSHIVDQLDLMDATRPDNVVEKHMKATQNALKKWFLFAPNRFIGYNLRNITGDTDPVVAANPAVLKEVIPAFKEMLSKEPKSRNHRLALELGVIDSGMTAKDIPNTKQMEDFKRFYAKDGFSIKNPVTKYFDTIRAFSEFRENALRLAAFNHYMKAFEAGKKVNYAATKPEVIDGIVRDLGTAHAAAKLANDLLGDYGNLTVFGSWVRDYAIPFWSFQEINLKRAPRIFANIITDPDRSPGGRTISTSLYATVLSARMLFMYAAFNAWNNLMFPDEEDRLNDFERQNPHLVLGKLDDEGNVTILRNAGAMGDFLEWFGVNDMVAMFPELLDGQMSIEDFLKDSIVQAPFNKLAQGITPIAKIPLEVGTGLSGFPDVFNPRQINKQEHLFSSLGVGDMYNQAQGFIQGDGSRARDYWLSRLIGVTNTKNNTVSAMYGLRDLYFNSIDKDIPSGFPPSKWRTLKRALVSGNQEAFSESRLFLTDEEGIDYTKFLGFLDRLDPITNMNATERTQFESEFLTGDQLKQLHASKVITDEWKIKGYQMWRESVAEQGPEALKEFESLQRKKVDSLSATIRRTSKSSKVEDRKKVRVSRDKAIDQLISMGITRKDLQNAMRRSGRSDEHKALVMSRTRGKL